MQPKGAKCIVLMADEGRDGTRLTREALAEGVHEIELSDVSDGQQLVDYLSRMAQQCKIESMVRPDVILLDR